MLALSMMPPGALHFRTSNVIVGRNSVHGYSIASSENTSSEA